MLAALSMCSALNRSNAIETRSVEPSLNTTPQPSQKQADLVFNYLLSPSPLSICPGSEFSLDSILGTYGERSHSVLCGGRDRARNVTFSHLNRDGVWDVRLL